MENQAAERGVNDSEPAGHLLERDERGRFKRREGPAREPTIPPTGEEDDFEIVDDPSPPKRRKFSIDLTNEDRPPVFVNLLQDDSDDEVGSSSTKYKAAATVKQEVKEEPRANTATTAASAPTGPAPAQQPMTLAGLLRTWDQLLIDHRPVYHLVSHRPHPCWLCDHTWCYVFDMPGCCE